jgi:hypothetical protein
MRVTVTSGQDWFDITLQQYGSLDSLFDLLRANSAAALDDDLQAGQTLDAPELPSPPDVLKIIRARGIRINTGSALPESNAPAPADHDLNHDLNHS